MLLLGEMIQRGQQEMARYIVDGLRKTHPRTQSRSASNHDTGDEGDVEDESEGDSQGAGGDRRRKARTPWENQLSVLFFPSPHIPVFFSSPFI